MMLFFRLIYVEAYFKSVMETFFFTFAFRQMWETVLCEKLNFEWNDVLCLDGEGEEIFSKSVER